MDEKIVKDYISRRQAIYVCLELIHERRKCLSDAGQKEISGIDVAMCAIQDLPSAQPERKRGRWNITDAYPHNVYCSECYTRFAQTHWAVWEDGSLPRNFCPNCGADMREVDDERLIYTRNNSRDV